MRKRGEEDMMRRLGGEGGEDGLERVEERKRKWNKRGGEVGRRGEYPTDLVDGFH